jgi:hypothetical protein
LLAAAVLLVAAPVALKALGLVAVVAHGVRRRPAPPPERLELNEDGACAWPGSSTVGRLGPKTRYTRGWVHLVDRSGALDLLLLEDQLDPADWAKLSALLRRLNVTA